MFTSIRKRMAVDSFVYPWNIGLSCNNCANQFTMLRRKKYCVFCKCSYCTLCIERRPDKRLSCRKCIVLTSRPIDRQELFNLKSRDLVDYLTSRHISTNDCIEKEDLVNAVIRSVNAPPHIRTSSSGSYPNTPRRNSSAFSASGSRSQDDIRLNEDGIRVVGLNDSDPSSPGSAPRSPSPPFVVVNVDDCVPDPPIASSAGEGSEQEEQSTSCEPPRKRLQLTDVDNEQDLDKLSVRQLKELLALNRIDFTGCVERSELLQKVHRLWTDYVERRKDVANLSHSELCKICMDAPMECVLLECGHIATCTDCGKQLSECPICRQFVIRCVRTFKA